MAFLHQTTTDVSADWLLRGLFLMAFLHQTTTVLGQLTAIGCCFLWHFYIKPQLYCRMLILDIVVSYGISTSNHNCHSLIVVWQVVVSYGISTSNHNCASVSIAICALFLMAFLHQTTTLFADALRDL